MSIQSEINRIAGAKSDIADAIVDMGGTLSSGASIDDMAAGVRTIPQGSGVSDYDDLTNRPQINSVTLTGNKSLSDIGAYAKPAGGIPASDLASDVQTSLGKADTALQSHQDISGKADKSSALSLTLAVASWSNETPPVQTLTANGVTADNNILIGVGSSVTSAQYDAACAAKLVCTAQGANSVTITCYGEKPSESIPITLVILG